MRELERIGTVTQLIQQLWELKACRDLRLWQVICLLKKQAKEIHQIDDVWNLEEN